VLYLASDDGRYITGTAQIIDAGALNPFKAPHLTVATDVPQSPIGTMSEKVMSSNSFEETERA